MKRLINYIDKSLLLKIASLNSVAIFTRVLVGFFTSKAIAYFIGPSGMALVGNLRDFTGSSRSFASLGFYNGIVKYISEFREDALKIKEKISTVLYSVLIASTVLAIVIFISSTNLSHLIFNGREEYYYVFRLFALALPFYSLNLILMAVLNGTARFKFLLKVSIIGHVFSGLITLYLIWQLNINGALIAVVISELVVLLIILIGLKNPSRYLKKIGLQYFDFTSLKNLGAYSLMSLFSAATLPLAYLFIRNYIGKEINIEAAGYWEAMNRISKYYLMFVTTLLSLYILPKLSAANDDKDFRYEVFNFYKQIVPLFAMGLVIIYLLREYLILLIFTQEFLEVKNLFLWQMLGDLLKVLSLVMSFQFLAKRMTRHYLITEIISILILIITSIYFIDIYGTVGANIAHFVTFAIYLIMIIFIFKKPLLGKS